MSDKIKLSRVVVVEGKYDKIKLSSLLDATIVTTEGFGIFNNEEKKAFFCRLAAEKGLIVLTDADGAGMMIRNYFRSILPPEQVIHLYVPPKAGKEKRKSAPSKEGLLGVEGTEADILRELFRPFGAAAAEDPTDTPMTPVTREDFFDDGLAGGENSLSRRKALCRAAALPENLSTKALLEILNLLGGRSYYEKLINNE